MKANCSVIQEDIDTMLDQIYEGDETVEQSEKVLESALIGVISALNSAGEIFDIFRFSTVRMVKVHVLLKHF